MEFIHVKQLNITYHKSPVWVPEGWSYEKRTADDYEFDYILSSNGGKMFTNGDTVTLAPGMFFMRSPGMEVQGFAQYTSWYLQFQTDSRLSFSCDFYNMNPEICTPLFRKLYDLHIQRPADYEYLVDYYMNTLLFHLYEEEKRLQDIRQKEHPLSAIYREMEKSWKKNLPLDYYVRLSGYSKSRFCHLFQEIYQISPIQFLHSLRLRNLCYKLIETDQSVKELMIEHGYVNEQSFFRTFKAYTGDTPGEYRKKHQLK